jgi:hypothetical protein
MKMTEVIWTGLFPERFAWENYVPTDRKVRALLTHHDDVLFEFETTDMMGDPKWGCLEIKTHTEKVRVLQWIIKQLYTELKKAKSR